MRRHAHIFERAALSATLWKVVNWCCEGVASHRIQVFLTLVISLGCEAPRLLIGVLLHLLIHLLVQLFKHEVVLRVLVVYELLEALGHLVLLDSAIACVHDSFPSVPARCILGYSVWDGVRLLMKHEIGA